MSWSADIGGCAKPGPAIVRGTRKVFFRLLVSFLVATAGFAFAAVSLAAASWPAPMPAPCPASPAACAKHIAAPCDPPVLGSLAGGVMVKAVG